MFCLFLQEQWWWWFCSFICTVMHCQGTWIWLESWYRLRPYSTWYHISILDVLYVAPFHLGCYVLSSFLIRQKTHTNLLLSYHCQIVLLFCWEFLVELNAAIFMRYKINSFHYIIKASVYSIYFNVEIDTVIIFSLNQKKHSVIFRLWMKIFSDFAMSSGYLNAPIYNHLNP